MFQFVYFVVHAILNRKNTLNLEIATTQVQIKVKVKNDLHFYLVLLL